MKHFLYLAKPTIYLLVLVFGCFSALLPPAKAALIPTAQTLSSDSEQTRATLQAMLARSDVQTQLVAWGVDPLEAQARVATLTDQELQALSAQVEQLPAGGSTAATVAVVSLIAFLVLLVTDILGYTDIFPFTK